MNILLIFAHPNLDSFNRAILDTVETTLQKNNHPTLTRDLYGLGFKPALTRDDLSKPSPDIIKEQEHIKWADALIFIYPIWWWDRPAILKGYIDRVFTSGLLHHQKALIIQTLGTDEQVYDQNPGAKEAIHRSMTEGTLQYCGIQQVEQLSLFGITASTTAERQQLLKQVADTIKNAFPGKA